MDIYQTTASVPYGRNKADFLFLIEVNGVVTLMNEPSCLFRSVDKLVVRL